MSNSYATKYHEIKVGILDNTCFKENVPTFEILVGWILRLGLNFWVINVALYGWNCDPGNLSNNAFSIHKMVAVMSYWLPLFMPDKWLNFEFCVNVCAAYETY